MSFSDLMPYPAPQKITIKDVEGDIRVPYERVKAYDDKEFELFIREWATSLSGKYQIRGFGGAGDKGRDVVAQDVQGKYYYFQCKHYDHPLWPSDMLPELGKLVYYTFTGEIPLPTEYYVLAPYDIGASLNDLIVAPKKLKETLLPGWDKNCKNKIMKVPIPITSDLQAYLSDNGIFRKVNRNGAIWSLSLSAAVFYLTPAASEGYRSTLKPAAFRNRAPSANLSAQVIRQEQPLSETAALNPDWVEWLMGFPRKWTDASSGTPSRRASPVSPKTPRTAPYG